MLSWKGLIDEEDAMLFESNSIYIGTTIFYNKVFCEGIFYDTTICLFQELPWACRERIEMLH